MTNAVAGARSDQSWLTGAAVTIIVCFLILVWRRFDQIVNPQFWAEDGHFYRWALMYGSASLLQPYAGYLHTVPRLVGLLSTAFDPAHAPRIFCTCAIALTLYVVWRIVCQRSRLPARYTLAVAVVLVPDAYEVLLTIVNIQWLLCLGLFLLALSPDPDSLIAWVHDATAAVLIGLTGPFSALFLPCFLWRAWQRRTNASYVLAGVIGICGLLQLFYLLRADSVASKPIVYSAILPGLGYRIAGSLLMGIRGKPHHEHWVGFMLGIVSITGTFILGILKGIERPARVCVVYAAVIVLVGTLYRCRFVLDEIDQPGFGARYFYPIQAFVIWLVLVAATEPPRWRKYFLISVGAWMVAVNVRRLREPAFEDMHWSIYAAEIRAGKAVQAKINPDGWTVDYPENAYRRK